MLCRVVPVCVAIQKVISTLFSTSILNWIFRKNTINVNEEFVYRVFWQQTCHHHITYLKHVLGFNFIVLKVYSSSRCINKFATNVLKVPHLATSSICSLKSFYHVKYVVVRHPPYLLQFNQLHQCFSYYKIWDACNIYTIEH